LRRGRGREEGSGGEVFKRRLVFPSQERSQIRHGVDKKTFTPIHHFFAAKCSVSRKQFPVAGPVLLDL
jgi:hypothetical protein